MGIILFLIDNSASMNQRTVAGTTLLDVAKTAVETFIKLRSRDPASRQDRYMLVSCDETPFCFKCGWRESHSVFVSELKNMHVSGQQDMSVILQQTFDLLNVHRLHTGIDNYGQGRNPFFLEPAVVIVITDSQSSSSNEELTITSKLCGGNLTTEAYRWDERLFSLMLCLPGMPSSQDLSAAFVRPSLSALCEATGGKSYVVTSLRMLNQSIESLVQKLHPGVVIRFEKMEGSYLQAVTNDTAVLLSKPEMRDSPVPMEVDQREIAVHNGPQSLGFATQSQSTVVSETANGVRGAAVPPDVRDGMRGSGVVGIVPIPLWYSSTKMIYVRPHPKTGIPSGHWPIPESFFPDGNTSKLLSRSAHPVVLFTCEDSPPLVIDNLPFDKYELEPSALTQFILERKMPSACWKVYIPGSGKTPESCYPFGYLKPSSNLQCVNLLVMPYNYPVILPLLDDLVKKYKMKPPRGWKAEFEKYLQTLPVYYVQPLRNALRVMGAPSGIVPDNIPSGLSLEVSTYLKRMKKQAKADSDKLLMVIANKPMATDTGQLLGSDGLPLKESVRVQSFRNPFDIPRSDLLDQLRAMRAAFYNFSSQGNAYVKEHSVPVSQMGNYQEFRRQHHFLREIDVTASGAGKTQLFGNPYKLERPDKHLVLDEANEAMVGLNQKRLHDNSSSRRAKRKRLHTPPRSPSPMPLMKKDSQRATNAAVAKLKLPSVDRQSQQQVSVGLKARPVESRTNSTVSANTVAAQQPQSGVLVKKQQPGNDNGALKNLIFKELRKPGKNFTLVFEHLGNVKGTVEVKRSFLNDIIREAGRFKRKQLVEQLKDWGEKTLTKSEVQSTVS
ncbi:integrator complex subunit 6-like [Corticium candelabrum]|uniref:integrator complex subunit 6-like n=1 Tax=Corticium candelabrum TaxID=121492 RepID=UPI002E266FFE|nr:integrator complex subunit 6-like [Corticium candelabrum]